MIVITACWQSQVYLGTCVNFNFSPTLSSPRRRRLTQLSTDHALTRISRFPLIVAQKMLLPCGLPPEREED